MVLSLPPRAQIHTISAALKSVLEWLSFEVHPFENKPVMIVGASYYDQGTSRASSPP